MDPSSEEGTKKRKRARVVRITLAEDEDIQVGADGSVQIVKAVRPPDDEVIDASKEDPQFAGNKKRETNRLTMILKKHLIGHVPDDLLARMIKDVEDGKVMNGATTAAWREFDQLHSNIAQPTYKNSDLIIKGQTKDDAGEDGTDDSTDEEGDGEDSGISDIDSDGEAEESLDDDSEASSGSYSVLDLDDE